MKQIHVGTYRLAGFNTRLYLNPNNSSASFKFADDKKSTAVITLGFEAPFNDEEGVTELLLHETFEAAAVILDLRYERNNNLSSQDCLFVFSHEQLNRIIKSQARFVCEAIPDLFKIIKKQRTKK